MRRRRKRWNTYVGRALVVINPPALSAWPLAPASVDASAAAPWAVAATSARRPASARAACSASEVRLSSPRHSSACCSMAEVSASTQGLTLDPVSAQHKHWCKVSPGL